MLSTSLEIRSLCILLISMMLFIGVPAYASGGAPSKWAKASVEEAIRAGIVPERLQGDYQKTITREEFASLFVQMVFAREKAHPVYKDYGVTREQYLASVSAVDYAFEDTDSEDVKLAYMLGFVNGTSPTTFSPNRPITREEAAVMLISYGQISLVDDFNSLEIADVDDISTWAKDALVMAYNNNLFGGTREAIFKGGEIVQKAMVNPKGNFTREQAILVALTFFKDGAYMTVRGIVPFDSEAAKYKFEVTKNSVRCVGIREGYYGNQWAWESFNSYKFGGKTLAERYPNITLTDMFAGEQRQNIVRNWLFDFILYEKLNAGENAKFDIGWAVYEVLNPNYLFEYRVKPDAGIHDFDQYGGSKELPAYFKLME